jgi:glycosyltransferase involved in cell wall biosynthesis
MASFNASRYIERAIESVLSVDGLDLELLIHDGVSTDGTQEIVARIDDPRVRLVSEPDAGQSDAWNHALARARGRWIGWLNADDIYLPGGVARVAELFDEPLDFVYGDYGTIDAEGGEMKRYRSSRPFNLLNLLRYGVFVNCSASFYRPELLYALGGLNPELHYCMDYDLLLRIARRGVRSQYVPATVQFLRTHPEAKTSKYIWRFFREGSGVAWRHSKGVEGGRIRVLKSVSIYFAYILTRPVWQTPLWRRIRPGKQL